MVGMHHGIHSHKIGNLVITVYFIYLEKFAARAVIHNKTILQKLCRRSLLHIKIIPVVHIAKIGSHRIGGYAGRYACFLIFFRLYQRRSLSHYKRYCISRFFRLTCTLRRRRRPGVSLFPLYLLRIFSIVLLLWRRTCGKKTHRQNKCHYPARFSFLHTNPPCRLLCGSAHLQFHLSAHNTTLFRFLV